MAGLVRARPDTDPGYRRVRSGSGFRYLDERGEPVPDAERERIRALVIPPAWTHVWIAEDPLAHIQAVGVDGAGRQQYLYHPQWRARRDRRKFRRAMALAEALPLARARVTRALGKDDGATRERVLAAAFRLLDDAAPRIGSRRYLLRHGSRGLTTLRRRDVTVDGTLATLSFPAKSGRRMRLEIEDPDLAAVFAELAEGPGSAPLLAYRRGRRRVPITPRDVNDYVHDLTGSAFTAKDFRTLRGTILAATALAAAGAASSASERKKRENAAVKETAAALGNTPAVARASYIDPRVFRRYAQGRVLDRRVAPETAIRRLLEP
ncbi:DNA topoisomerase IB [Microbacterium sp. 22242]|uniref:DNA topoisomerase IB n=1 Tax=Microbacterium sp. 22242 TaxID=3453896 RepID=UPI003F86FE96